LKIPRVGKDFKKNISPSKHKRGRDFIVIYPSIHGRRKGKQNHACKNLSKHHPIKHLYKKSARVMPLSTNHPAFHSGSDQLVRTYFMEMFSDI